MCGYTWLTFFKDYFIGLRNQGLFDGTDVDILCIRAIYLPVIRRAIDGYCLTWANHDLRRQTKKRPNSVHGKPSWLYEEPEQNGTKRFMRELPEEMWRQCEAEYEGYGKLLCLNVIISVTTPTRSAAISA